MPPDNNIPVCAIWKHRRMSEKFVLLNGNPLASGVHSSQIFVRFSEINDRLDLKVCDL